MNFGKIWTGHKNLKNNSKKKYFSRYKSLHKKEVIAIKKYSKSKSKQENCCVTKLLYF